MKENNILHRRSKVYSFFLDASTYKAFDKICYDKLFVLLGAIHNLLTEGGVFVVGLDYSPKLNVHV